jgi:hypothetical protein
LSEPCVAGSPSSAEVSRTARHTYCDPARSDALRIAEAFIVAAIDRDLDDLIDHALHFTARGLRAGGPSVNHITCFTAGSQFGFDLPHAASTTTSKSRIACNRSPKRRRARLSPGPTI